LLGAGAHPVAPSPGEEPMSCRGACLDGSFSRVSRSSFRQSRPSARPRAGERSADPFGVLESDRLGDTLGLPCPRAGQLAWPDRRTARDLRTHEPKAAELTPENQPTPMPRSSVVGLELVADGQAAVDEGGPGHPKRCHRDTGEKSRSAVVRDPLRNPKRRQEAADPHDPPGPFQARHRSERWRHGWRARSFPSRRGRGARTPRRGGRTPSARPGRPAAPRRVLRARRALAG